MAITNTERRPADGEMQEFPIKSYPKGDLAMLYCPAESFHLALRKLNRWMHQCPPLMQELEENGYHRFRHCFLKKEVEIILKHFGAP